MPQIDPISLLVLGILFTWTLVLVGFPLAATLLVLRWRRPAWRIVRRPFRSIVRGTIIAYVLLLGIYVLRVGPWRSGVVTAGKAADGREYCVIQTYANIAEPFQVSLFVRDDGGMWRWYYLDHEADGWRSAKVDVVGGIARVEHDGERMRDIPLETTAVALESVPATERALFRPASFSVRDLEAMHHAKFSMTR